MERKRKSRSKPVSVITEAISHWTSVAGGSHTQDEAETWSEMEANRIKWGIVHDMDGPNTKHPLRMRIHTGDDIDYENVGIRAKEAAAQLSPVTVSNSPFKIFPLTVGCTSYTATLCRIKTWVAL